MPVGGWEDSASRKGSGSSVYGGGASSMECRECDDNAGSAWRPIVILLRTKEGKCNQKVNFGKYRI